MQSERSLKVWDRQSLYVAKKKGYAKLFIFVRKFSVFTVENKEIFDDATR